MSEVITIEEARELLGDSAKNMSDEEIDKVVDNLDSLARAFIQSYLRGEMKLPTDLEAQVAKPKVK